MNAVGADSGLAKVVAKRFRCEGLLGTEIATVPYRSEEIQVDFGMETIDEWK